MNQKVLILSIFGMIALLVVLVIAFMYYNGNLSILHNENRSNHNNPSNNVSNNNHLSNNNPVSSGNTSGEREWSNHSSVISVSKPLHLSDTEKGLLLMKFQCSTLNGSGKKGCFDDYYSTKAQVYSNVSLCYKISDSIGRDSCAVSVMESLAIKENNPNLCDKINYSTTCKDDYYEHMALSKNDSSLCNKIINDVGREWCNDWFSIPAKYRKECGNLDSVGARSWCVAIHKKCDGLKNETERKKCLSSANA